MVDRFGKLGRFVIAPTLTAMAILALILGTFLYLSTSRSDALALERQKHLVNLDVQQSEASIVTDQEGSTLWDDAVMRLRQRPLDLDWIDNNLGIWFYTHYGHDEVYILRPDGKAVYAMHTGVRVPAASFSKIATAVSPLVRDLRGKLRNGYVAPEGSASQTVGALGRMVVAGRPAIVSVKPVVSETGSVPQAAGSEYVHIAVRYLDGSFLTALSSDFGIEGARFVSQPDGRATVPVTGLDGAPIGFITWQPFMPGRHVAQRMIPVMLSALAMTGILFLLMLYRIWTSRIELETSRAQAQYLAFHDTLTGLPNRALFDNRLKHALAKRRPGKVAVVMLDLDRFKNVNDTLGHHAGDALIREFGVRLSGLLREGDTVARLGGDEFALLIEDAVPTTLQRLCERILEAVRRPFDVLENRVFVGVSAGVAISAAGGDDATEITRKADIALYRAKGEGRDRYRIFDPSMDATVKLRSTIEIKLRQALLSGEGLCVHYQPEVSGVTGKVLGFEALVRWDHPTRGLIAPEHFIPVAEETGLIVPLGEWVLDQACSASRRWPGLFFAVNLSPVQFQTPDLVDRIIAIARKNQADPGAIQLEVTEQVLLNDTDAAKVMITRLRAAGFQVVLDDFGTGYSSLSYLREFQVDKIKIDRTFIDYLTPGDESSSIVLAMLSLGHAMGLTVTAEGVETEDQRRFLSAAGCTEMQGFLFSRAVPEDQLRAVLGNGRADNAVA